MIAIALLSTVLLAAPSTQPAATEVPVVESVEVVMASPSAFVGRNVRLTGTALAVCQPRGCWMELGAEGDTGVEPLFVKFVCSIDGDRLIPLEAVGRRATVEGVLVAQTVSVEELRHFAEDAGATAEEVAAITEPEVRYTLQSPAAVVDMPEGPFVAGEPSFEDGPATRPGA